MPTEHFANLSKHLAEFLAGMLASIKDEELRDAGFLRREEVNIAFGMIERRTEEIASAALNEVYTEFGKLQLSDLMNELEARKAGQ